MPKSFKTEVQTSHQGQLSWASNSLRFATEREADEAGRELLDRWTVPIDSRATESDDAINYRFNFDTYKSERL